MALGWLEYLRGLKQRGFVGPKYRGIVGKARLLKQGLFGHIEIVSYAEPERWIRPTVDNSDVNIVVSKSFDEAVPFLAEMKSAYHRDFTSEWKRYFGWGQIAVFALMKGRLAAFVWIQDGSRGATVPYLPLFPGEFRLVRGGVIPDFRGNKIHTTRHILVLEYLFSMGARRVYIDAFADNVYSWKGQHKAGYSEIGKIHVKKTLRGKTYVRWIARSSTNEGKE